MKKQIINILILSLLLGSALYGCSSSSEVTSKNEINNDTLYSENDTKEDVDYDYDYNYDYTNEELLTQESDLYNGFPAPTELKLTASNGKYSLNNSNDYKIDIDGLYLIKDADGYDYLILTYTLTNLLSDQKISKPFSFDPDVYQGEGFLSSISKYKLSEECRSAYDEIISDDYISELRPGEQKTQSCIYEIYDTSSDLTLLINNNYAYVTNPNGEIVLYDEQDLETDIIRVYSFN